MEKKKLLFVSDSVYLSTGFSVVTRNLIKILSDKYDCRCFCMVNHKPTSQMPIQYINSGKSSLREQFAYCIDNFKPDLVISVCDVWRLAFMADVKIDNPFKWFAYIPVEGCNFPKKIEWDGKWINLSALLSYAETKIAYSNFGADQLKKSDIEPDGFIYHGVDTSIFNRLNLDVAKKKDEYFDLKNNEKIFLCVADNSIRKRYDLLIEAWSKYKEKKESSDVLVLLTERIRNNGYDLDLLIREFNVENSVFLFPTYKHGKGFPAERLIELYNISDFVVSAAGGEGFGLPLLEALACGCGIIFPDYATPYEVFSGCENAYSIDIKNYRQAPGTYQTWCEIDTDFLADLFENAKITNVKESIDFASNFKWECFRGQWENAIIKALRKPIKKGVVV